MRIEEIHMSLFIYLSDIFATIMSTTIINLENRGTALKLC
jgi:hypothetical protein